MPAEHLLSASTPRYHYNARLRISPISSVVSTMGLPLMELETEAFSISSRKSSSVTP